MMHSAGMDVCRLTNDRKSSTDRSLEKSTCRRWPVWAISTSLAIARHDLKLLVDVEDDGMPMVLMEAQVGERWEIKKGLVRSGSDLQGGLSNAGDRPSLMEGNGRW